jgi:iron complex outermembrane receptor protein
MLCYYWLEISNISPADGIQARCFTPILVLEIVMLILRHCRRRIVTVGLSGAIAYHGAWSRHRLFKGAGLFLGLLLMALPAVAQSSGQSTGVITGTVMDPQKAAIVGIQVTLTDLQTKAKTVAVTDANGVYLFPSLQPGAYIVTVDAKGFKSSESDELKVESDQTVKVDFSLEIGVITFKVTVIYKQGTIENAYRVDTVKPGGPLGTTPILDAPYSVYVLPRDLIDNTMARNFKEAVKYMPTVSFQEMQGPEVLRPESRGMQGSNMQNDRKDGMGIAVTTPSAMEEYDQIEIVTGLGGPLYGPANPSGMFNLVTKRPTDEPLREFELGYEGSSVGTAHIDLGGRFGPNHIFGYRTNLLLADGTGYVTDSQLRRQLASLAVDVRPSTNTVIEGNYSYYNVFQHGYPGWFAYGPFTKNKVTSFIELPVDAPDPTRQGYGQSFAGVDLKSKIGEVRVKHNFSSNWKLVVGVLDQISDRNLNTPVNQMVDKSGDYQSYLANTFSSLAPRFHVYSDLAYLTGRFNTGIISHDVVIGGTGYKFSSYSPVTSFTKTALCTEQGVCSANIDHPLVFVEPATGLPVYNNIYVSSIIHQQGFSLGDTITFTPHWLVKVAASQDWTWVDNYNNKKVRTTGYDSNGISPSASLMFKPKPSMTIYGTYASSIQAPDIAGSGLNVNQALPPYRSKEEEIGYKLTQSTVNFTAALFRIERPFANLNPTDNLFEITGDQINYGIELTASGHIIKPLMIYSGITILDPKLTDTGNATTNNKQFVGMPNYKSNILAEYQLPVLSGLFFNYDWQHVGRRPIDDINSTWTTQYNVFDMGFRYTIRAMGTALNWRISVNNLTNVHYWSTLGPGNITGTGTGSFLGHLGEPRLITMSIRAAL